ncbi:MAG TPA: AI-2E family transporter [Candidatus Saccharimonadales bacterium]|nr:AI-2E family transporter [Candidatus Saccharimonadales bacterium]
MPNIFSSKERGEYVRITVSNRTVFRVLVLVALATLGLAALHKAAHALILVFTAFFLALALNSPVHWLARHIPGKFRGNRTVATSISFLVIVIFLAGFLASIVPPLVRQTSNFISAAPNLVAEVRDQNNQIGSFVRKHKLENQVENLSNQLSQRLKNVGGSAVSTAAEVGTSIFSGLTILVLTFMMLIEGPRWLKVIGRIMTNEHRKRAERLSGDMYKVVKGYVNGQVFLAALASAFIVPALFILHISYPMALVVIIFICGLIPLVGHTIGAIIVTAVALFHSVPAAIIVLAYYILYQQIETYVIQPRIQANSTNMSPLLVFGSVIIGVSFGGLFAGLVAIPVAGCIRIAVIDYLKAHHNYPNIDPSEVPKPAPTKAK